jgi:hypothetical protein
MTNAVFESVVSIEVCGKAGSAGSAYGLSCASVLTFMPKVATNINIKEIDFGDACVTTAECADSSIFIFSPVCRFGIPAKF